jgi:cyclin-dependent kinase 7
MRRDQQNFGVNISAIREIKFLQVLRHENVINLRDLFSADGAVHMVLEFCFTDLSKVNIDET